MIQRRSRACFLLEATEASILAPDWVVPCRISTGVVTDAAKEWLALTGFDPSYGARPLRRLIQQAIGDTLARELLAGDVRDGDEVVVDLDPSREGLRVAAA